MGDALGSSGRSMRTLFEAIGHQFIEIALTSPDWPNVLNETIANTPIAFAFSHVGMLADLSAETSDKRQVNFWVANGIPFISFFGDSPAYFFDRHVAPGPNFAFLYAFPEHYLLRKKLPKTAGLLGVTPTRAIDETPKREIDFGAKQTGKLLFLKNGNDPAQLVNSWRSALPLSTFQALADLAGHFAGQLTSDVACDIDGVVRRYFDDKGLDLDELPALRLLFIAQLDDYVRRVKSTMIAEALKQFPVEIHGYNWEHVDFSKCRAKYVYGGDYTASRQRIKDALGVIDMSPNTGMRPHDRPLRAFGLHTLCITNEQSFFKEQFPETYQDFSFEFNQESIEGKVAEVLASPRRFIELGVNVAETFCQRFEARAFAQTLSDIADSLRLVAGGRPSNMQQYFVWPPSKLG